MPARKKPTNTPHLEFVRHQRDIGSLVKLKKQLASAVENEYISGRKILLREFSAAKVVSFISDRMLVKGKSGIATKSKQKLLNYRAFTAYVLRVLCGLGYKEICSMRYNITISGCSRLCSRGYELLGRQSLYEGMFNELVSCKM